MRKKLSDIEIIEILKAIEKEIRDNNESIKNLEETARNAELVIHELKIKNDILESAENKLLKYLGE